MRLSLALLTLAVIGCQSPVPESSTAQESVVVNPSTYDFGSVQVGGSSGVFTVSVDPGGRLTSDVVNAVTASCPDFSINAQYLPADVFSQCVTCLTATAGTGTTTQGLSGEPDAVMCLPALVCTSYEAQSYYFDATFKPTVAGPLSCVVTVVLNNGTSTKTLTLYGTGTPPPIDVKVAPASPISFGDVRRNTDSSAAMVTVTNLGGQTATISSVAVTGAAFAMTGAATYTLGAGQATSHMLTCHPSAVGLTTGSLKVVSNDPDTPSVTIPLSCNGIDSNLDVTPSPAAMPTTRVGEPVDLTITLANTGAAGMMLESVKLTSTTITMTAAPPMNTALPGGGGSTQVKLHFPAGAPMDATGTLVATYDGGQTRSTGITAKAQATSMSLTPNGDVDFGPVCVGQNRSLDFTAVSTDDGYLTVKTVAAPGGPFTATPTTVNALLNKKSAQTKFTIKAAPTAPGPATASTVVHTDMPQAPDVTVNLAVLGLPAGVTATPELADLGFKHINATTIGQELHLSNCKTAPVAFANARLEGPNADEFVIVQQPSSAMIAPSEHATWLVVMTARTIGTKNATFRVDYDGVTAEVPLTGEGVGDPVPHPPDRGSYYACSTGGPGALGPVGLAIGLALRRRRRR